MVSRVPSTGLPRGCDCHKVSANRSWIRSSGASSRIPISSRITVRSASTSDLEISEFWTMSHRYSTAMGRSRSRTREWYVVDSFAL